MGDSRRPAYSLPCFQTSRSRSMAARFRRFPIHAHPSSLWRTCVFGYWNDSSDFGIGDTIIAYNPPTEVYPTISSPTLGTFTFRTKSIPVKKVVNNIYYVYETSSSKLYMYRQIPILSTPYLISGKFD